jgi:hypothetical protein
MKCQLRASWRDLSIDSRRVIEALQAAGVTACTVTPGWSLCKDFPDEPPELERSVIIDLYSAEKDHTITALWPALRDALNLTCIHVHELGRGFTGCVHDYMGGTVCPHHVAETAPPAAHVPMPSNLMGGGSSLE